LKPLDDPVDPLPTNRTRSMCNLLLHHPGNNTGLIQSNHKHNLLLHHPSNNTGLIQSNHKHSLLQPNNSGRLANLHHPLVDLGH